MSDRAGLVRALLARRDGKLVLLPAFLWWALLLITPIALVLVSSFFRRGPFGGVVYEFTLDNYIRALDPLYVGVLVYSVQIASITTAICWKAYPI